MPRKKTSTKNQDLPSKNQSDRKLDNVECGLWIDPDIWRRIRGEGGRRGVEGLPSISRYLQYADLALKNAKKPNLKPVSKSKNKSRS
jgi:hypothetical protein